MQHMASIVEGERSRQLRALLARPFAVARVSNLSMHLLFCGLRLRLGDRVLTAWRASFLPFFLPSFACWSSAGFTFFLAHSNTLLLRDYNFVCIYIWSVWKGCVAVARAAYLQNFFVCAFPRPARNPSSFVYFVSSFFF